MALIPNVYARRRTPGFSRPMPAMRGSGQIAEAGQRLGASLFEAADASDSIVEDHANARDAELETEAARKIDDLLYNPESGLFAKSGRDALDGRKRVIERMAEIRKETLENASGRNNDALGVALAGRIGSATNRINTFTVEQRKAYTLSVGNARIALAGDDALRDYSDGGAMLSAIKTADAVIDGMRGEMGWSDEETALRRRAERSKIVLGRIDRVAADNPVAALELARTHKDYLSGADFAALETRLVPAAKEYEGRNAVRDLYSGGGGSLPGVFGALLRKHEGGAKYDTLFGFSNRPGGRFAGVDVSKMTVAQVIEFTKPNGEYGQWVKAELGRLGHKARVATPTGAGQIVGKTLRAAVRELGISGDTIYSPELQNRLIMHLAGKRIKSGMSQSEKRAALRSEWEGFKHAPNASLDAAVAEIEGVAPVTASSKNRRSAIISAIEAETDPIKRDAMIRELKVQEALRAGQAVEARANLERAAFDHVLSGGAPADLPHEVKLGLGRSEMSALTEYHKKQASGVPVETDPGVLYRMTRMLGSNPKGFAALNLMEYIDKLSPQHFDEMRKEQAKILKSGDVTPKYGKIKEALNRVAPGTFDFNKPLDDGDIGQRSHGAWTAMVAEFDAFVDREGRQPNEREAMEIASRATAKITTSKGWLSDYEKPAFELAAEMRENFEAGKPITIDGESITSDEMREVIDRYVARGGRAPATFVESIEIYRAAVRRAASAEPDPVSNRASPVALTAPDDGGGPRVGGVGRAPTIGAGQSLGAPVSPSRGPLDLPQTDGASLGIPAQPAGDDPVEWDFFGLKVGIALQQSDAPISLGNGVEIDVFDWADVRGTLGPGATPGQIVRALLEDGNKTADESDGSIRRLTEEIHTGDQMMAVGTKYRVLQRKDGMVLVEFILGTGNNVVLDFDARSFPDG